jgi:hypothetical protein
VPYVLAVAALELGYPVLLLVLPEVDDSPLNCHHSMRFPSHFGFGALARTLRRKWTGEIDSSANSLKNGDFGTPREARVVPVAASLAWDH